jgi:hypothetical protein
MDSEESTALSRRFTDQVVGGFTSRCDDQGFRVRRQRFKERAGGMDAIRCAWGSNDFARSRLHPRGAPVNRIGRRG